MSLGLIVHSIWLEDQGKFLRKDSIWDVQKLSESLMKKVQVTPNCREKYQVSLCSWIMIGCMEQQ